MADYGEPYITLKFNGINYDIPPYDLELDKWTDGKNVRFSDGVTEKFEGHRQVFGTLLNAPNWFMPVGYGANYYWVYASDTAVAVTDMTTHSNITPVAGVNADLDTNWNGGLINNLVVMNNGNEPPIWWDGATSSPMTDLPAWPVNHLAEIIRPYKSYLVAMNISDATGEFPDLVKWSDAAAQGAVPASWDASDPTIDAGETILADTPGEIVDGAQMGDAFIIYKRTSCYIMQYIGGQFIFSFRKLFDGIGALAPNCIASIAKQHLVLSGDDLILHDGTTSRSVIDNKMRSWLFSSMNVDYYHRSYLVAYYARNEVWVCVPTGDSEYANIALVWNYEDDTIGFRDIPLSRHISVGIIDPGAVDATVWDDDSDTWDTDSSTWDALTFSPTAYSVLLGDQGNVQFLEGDRENTYDDVNMKSYIVRESMPLIDRHNFKLLKAVYPRMESSSDAVVKVRVGAQKHATDPISWSTAQDFTIGQSDKLDFLVKGRYFSFRVDSDSDINWKLNSIDFELELAERF